MVTENTTAIILSGGAGLRLRDVVNGVPAILAPVAGKPFLAYVLEMLARKGMKEVILAVGYKSKTVEQTFGDDYAGLNLRYSNEHTTLGTGGAFLKALDRYNSTKSVWVLDGNTYFDCDFHEVEQLHDNNSADVTMPLKHVQNVQPYQYEVVSGKNDIIDGLTSNGEGHEGWIYAGISLVNPESILRFDLREQFSLLDDLYTRYLMDMRLFGPKQDGTFVEIVTPTGYEKAKEVLPRN